MWVFEEEVDGEKLTEIINTKHENVKYLPVRYARQTFLGTRPPQQQQKSQHSSTPTIISLVKIMIVNINPELADFWEQCNDSHADYTPMPY